MRDNILGAGVPITLDGQPYELRYHAYAFIQYADAVGGDLLHDLRTLGESLRGFEAAQHDADAPPVALGPLLIKIRDALWAGLIEAHPDVTRDDVARMFGFSDLNAIAPVMMQAITRTLPDAPQAKTPRPTRAASSRRDLRPNGGLDSGPSSATDPASAPASSNP